MIIGKPELLFKDGYLLYKVSVHFSEKTETLWFKLSAEFADLVSEYSDAPLLALLIPAMLQNEDISIEGTVSEKLYYNLSNEYQKVLRLIIPSLHHIKITASEIRPVHSCGEGVATGFSAGIDSFCVLADHHYSEVPHGFRVTHLLFNNVGSHGPDREKSRQLFYRRYHRLKPVTKQIGLPFIAIDSNMDSFYTGLDFVHTHTPRNVSVALLLQKGLKRFLYASAYPYSKACVRQGDSMGRSDTITLSLLSTETMDMISSGSQYTRVEKTLKVAEIKESHKSLDVCTDEDPRKINCSDCFKCKRTMLTLEIAGKLDLYADVFDLDIYEKNRDRYIEEVLMSEESFPKEIASFIQASGFNVPIPSRNFLLTRFFPILSQIKPSRDLPIKIGRIFQRKY